MADYFQSDNIAEHARVCAMLLHAYYVRDPRVMREAEALRDAGWCVTVICLNAGDEKDAEDINGVRIIRCRMSRSRRRTRFRFILEYGSFMLRSLLRLWREDSRKKYDVVIVHNMPNALVFSTLPLRLRGCPVVLDMHDAAPEVFAGLFGLKSRLWNKFLLFEEKLAMKYASALITVNRGVEVVFKERNPWASFLLLHNSPSANHLPPRPSSQFHGEGEFKIVFHGHVHERNGVQTIISGISALAAKGVKIELDIYGDGPYRQRLEQMVQQLALTDAVLFHGAFEPEELSKALSEQHLGVAPHFRDILGDLLLPVKILEYTQAGIPVLCSRLTTVEAYFSDECIYYFETDEELVEQIVEISQNYGSALARADRARKVAESISWESESAKLIDYVTALCDSR